MGCGGSTNMNGDSAPTPFSIKGLSVGNPLSNSDSNNKLNPSATTPGCHQDYCQEKNGGGGSVEHRDGGAVLSPDVSHPTSGTTEDMHSHRYREDAAGHISLAHTPLPHHHHRTTPSHNGMMTFKSILTEEEREAAADHRELPPLPNDVDSDAGGSNNNYVFDNVAPLDQVETGNGSFVPLGSTPLTDYKNTNGDDARHHHEVEEEYSSSGNGGVSPFTSFPNVSSILSPSHTRGYTRLSTTSVTFGFPVETTTTTPVMSSDRFPSVMQARPPLHRTTHLSNNSQYHYPPLTEPPRRRTLTVVPSPTFHNSNSHDNNAFIPPVHIAGCVELLSATETSMTSSGSTLLSSAAPMSGLPPNQVMGALKF